MSKLTEWSFRNKAAIGLLVVMSLVFGFLSYLKLPMEFLPAADNPQVMITAIGAGSSAKSMEENVTAPLENAVQFIGGKTSMYSTTGDGYTQISLNFDSKKNMKEAKTEVESAVAGVSLPSNVMKPFVVQLNTSMIPIAWITLSFPDGMNQHERALHIAEVETELKKLDGVGQISVSGRSNPIVQVEPKLEELTKAGMPPGILMGALQGRSVNSSLGEQTIGGQTANVNVFAEIDSLQGLKSLSVAPGVTLGEIADVGLAQQQESVSRMNGQDAVMMTITKTADANAVTVGRLISDKVEALNDNALGIEAKMPLSTAESVVTSVESMLREVLLGALFATIVILIFMRNFKATIVTIVSIPLSLGITLYLLDLSGVSLNIITLGGVAVAVGRLVDDSIVVIENIYRRLQKEAFCIELVTSATREVASAITSSTIVTVAVFLPMGLLRGSLQAFLLPFALTVTYSLLSSLVVALTVVPLLSAVLLKGTKEKEHGGSPRFASFLAWNLRHKWIALTVASALLVGSVGLYLNMPKGALDSSSAENISVSLEYPSDTPRPELLEASKKMEQEMMGSGDTDWVMMWLGNSSENAQYGSVSSPTLITYIADLRTGVDAEVYMEELLSKKGDYPGAELQVNATDLMMGGGSSEIFIDIMGDDLQLLEETAGNLKAAIAPASGVLKVESNQEERKTVYTFRLKPDQAKGEEVALQLYGALNPVPLGSIKLDGESTAVMLAPAASADSEQSLAALTVLTENGPEPITAIAELVRSQEPSLYYHKEGKPYLRVTASADPKLLSQAGNGIDKAIEKLSVPEGVTLAVGGASAEQSGDFADLGMTALISIGLVYLIMVLTFKTLRAPLAIMISLPLAAIGAVTALIVSGVTPDFTAMFGALMLIGIVVTNAIVLIDRVKQNEETMTIRAALIEAAATRMRPILMTALATISAMLPLVFGSHESGSIVSQSLAVVVIGGLVAATLLTLVIVPCVYELLYFRKSFKQRKADHA
ncbi:efflux RND transporter permease subunit [Paenibacillus sp. CAU 1782]